MVPYVVATTRYGGQLEHSGFAVTLVEASQTDLRYQVCKLRTRYPFLYDDLYLNWLAWDPRYSNVYVPVVPSPPASPAPAGTSAGRFTNRSRTAAGSLLTSGGGDCRLSRSDSLGKAIAIGS